MIGQVSQVLKTLLNDSWATFTLHSEVICCDIVVRIWVYISIEEQNGSRGSQSALEPLWELHAEPGGEHTTVGASTNDDSAILHSVGLLN